MFNLNNLTLINLFLVILLSIFIFTLNNDEIMIIYKYIYLILLPKININLINELIKLYAKLNNIRAIKKALTDVNQPTKSLFKRLFQFLTFNIFNKNNNNNDSSSLDNDAIYKETKNQIIFYIVCYILMNILCIMFVKDEFFISNENNIDVDTSFNNDSNDSTTTTTTTTNSVDSTTNTFTIIDTIIDKIVNRTKLSFIYLNNKFKSLIYTLNNLLIAICMLNLMIFVFIIRKYSNSDSYNNDTTSDVEHLTTTHLKSNNFYYYLNIYFNFYSCFTLTIILLNILNNYSSIRNLLLNIKETIIADGINSFISVKWSHLKVPNMLRFYFLIKILLFITQFFYYKKQLTQQQPNQYLKLNDMFSFNNVFMINFNDLLNYNDVDVDTSIIRYALITLVLYLTNTMIAILSLTSVLAFIVHKVAMILKKFLFPNISSQQQQRNRNGQHHQQQQQHDGVDHEQLNIQQQQQRDNNEPNDLLEIGEITAILFVILSIQSGLTQLKSYDRLFKLIKNFLLLFIALLHFLHRILDQQLMQLSATTSYKLTKTDDSKSNKNNKNTLLSLILTKKHLRVLLMSVFLAILPIIMLTVLWFKCKISTWLLSATCFNLELFIKMCVTLVIYTLFLIDTIRLKQYNEIQLNEQENNDSETKNDNLWENFDDYIYYIKSFGRICEFIFAIFLFFNSAFILLFESYGSIRAIMMCLHAYFHIYLQAHKGWKEFIKRYTAVTKMKQLPIFEQINENDSMRANDLCAICYYEIKTAEARITVCNHLFHSICLRKWLYIRDTCPLCQSVVYKTITTPVKTRQQQQQQVNRNHIEANQNRANDGNVDEFENNYNEGLRHRLNQTAQN